MTTTSVSSNKETADLKKKIDDMLLEKKKKVKNNYSNIETFRTLTALNDDTVNDTPDKSEEGKTLKELKTELYDIKNLAETIVKNGKEANRKRELRWKKAFAFLTDLKPKDMGIKMKGIHPEAKGWGKIFKALFYMYPILAELVVGDCVAATPIIMEGDISAAEFKQNKKHDGDIMVNTAYEFGYVLVALYFSHMMYARLYIPEYKLQPIKNMLSTGIGGFDFLLSRIVFLYLTLVPAMMYHFYYDVVKNLISVMGLEKYNTLKFIFIFIVCYGIAYFFLDKLAKMILQTFDGKASPFIYIVIVISWIVHLLSLPLDAAQGVMTESTGTSGMSSSITKLAGMVPESVQNFGNLVNQEGELGKGTTIPGFPSGGLPQLPGGMGGVMSEMDIMVRTNGLYIFVLLIHLVLSLLLFAPVCQLIVVIYILYTMMGTPSNIIGAILSLITGASDSFLTAVAGKCKESSNNDPADFWLGFDKFSFSYVYRYLFMFVMLLFFSFKTIQSGIELRLLSLRTAVTSINAYIFAFIAVCYFGRIYYENYISKDSLSSPKNSVPTPTPNPRNNEADGSMFGKAGTGLFGSILAKATSTLGEGTLGALTGNGTNKSDPTAYLKNMIGENNETSGMNNILSAIGTTKGNFDGISSVAGKFLEKGRGFVFKNLLTKEKLGGLLDVLFKDLPSSPEKPSPSQLQTLLEKLPFDQVVAKLTTDQTVQNAVMQGKVGDFLFAIIDVLLSIETKDQAVTEIQAQLKTFIADNKGTIIEHIPNIDLSTLLASAGSVASMVAKNTPELVKLAGKIFESGGDVNKIIDSFMNTKMIVPFLTAILNEVKKTMGESNTDILTLIENIMTKLPEIKKSLENFKLEDHQIKSIFNAIQTGDLIKIVNAIYLVITAYILRDEASGLDKPTKDALVAVFDKLFSALDRPDIKSLIAKIDVKSIIGSIVHQ
jgi:hypothetical protein